MSNLKIELSGNNQDQNKVDFLRNSLNVVTLACTVGGLERWHTTF